MVLFSFLSIVDDVKNGPVNSDSVKLQPTKGMINSPKDFNKRCLISGQM